jgi:hypothetical protein
VALREVQEPAGPPWSHPLAGALDELTVESELLAGNPLGDPTRRPLYVYRSPGVTIGGDAGSVPSVYVIQGYSGQVDAWLARTSFEPTVIERIDALFAAGDCPEAVVVFVDAWTSLGGSQFINSSAIGPYMDYLCDEVVPFVDQRYPTIARWLDWDPVRMAPRHAEALRGMRRIYLDAGTSDEFFLDLGAQAFAAELEKLGVAHTLELFDGTHGGISYRYPGAIRELVLALA